MDAAPARGLDSAAPFLSPVDGTPVPRSIARVVERALAAPPGELIERGVIGDFREPNLVRFGFAPLYNGFADVWRAVDSLADILGSRSWDAPRFHQEHAHEARNTKNMASATMLATTAMTTDPATLAARYEQR